jgi:hypothetical protein
MPRLVLVLSLLVICFCLIGADNSATNNPPTDKPVAEPEFNGSSTAQSVLSRFNGAVKKAQDQFKTTAARHDQQLDAARKEYIGALKREQTSPAARANADLAQQIKDFVAALESLAKPPADPDKPAADKPVAEPDLTKASPAAQAATTKYHAADKKADDLYQAAQAKHDQQLDAARKECAAGLTKEQLWQTKRGNAELARQIGDFVGVLESGKPIATPDARPSEWFVLFRCADPAIWNRNVNEGPEHVAVPVKDAPEDLQWLKMAMSADDYVIIPMTKSRLGVAGSEGRYGWEGDGYYRCNSHHLGIYDTTRSVGNNGISVNDGERVQGFMGGWGFGHHNWVDAAPQGFAWNAKNLDVAPVFEISVQSRKLTPEEAGHLLK